MKRWRKVAFLAETNNHNSISVPQLFNASSPGEGELLFQFLEEETAAQKGGLSRRSRHVPCPQKKKKPSSKEVTDTETTTYDPM